MNLEMGDIVLNMDLRTVRKNEEEMKAYADDGFYQGPSRAERPDSVLNKTNHEGTKATANVSISAESNSIDEHSLIGGLYIVNPQHSALEGVETANQQPLWVKSSTNMQ